MKKLILARHAMPTLDGSRPAREWELSEEGRASCEVLAQRLAAHAPSRVVTSQEPKAVETGQIVARALGLPWETAESLGEHQRSKVGLMPRPEDFRAAVLRLFQEPDKLVLGDETANQALERFSSALERVLQQYPEETLVVVSHGTVLSLWAGPRAGMEPAGLWLKLGLPAYLVISRPDLRLLELVEEVGYP